MAVIAISRQYGSGGEAVILSLDICELDAARLLSRVEAKLLRLEQRASENPFAYSDRGRSN
jgi:hypothetical protein